MAHADEKKFQGDAIKLLRLLKKRGGKMYVKGKGLMVIDKRGEFLLKCLDEGMTLEKAQKTMNKEFDH